MSKSRVEAFSDGVIAIAITLLVLDIPVPERAGPHGLAHDLGHNWPHFVAYAVSFLTIGVIWINHHAALRRLIVVDHGVLALNLLLLLFIGLLPFSTALMANFLRRHSGAHLAAAIYAGSFLAMSITFFAMQRYVLSRPGILDPTIDEASRRVIARRNAVGLIPYAVATAAAALSPYVTLAICGAIALYYALPQTTAT
jgi:uncharacterized membrane protein